MRTGDHAQDPGERDDEAQEQKAAAPAPGKPHRPVSTFTPRVIDEPEHPDEEPGYPKVGPPPLA